MAQFNEGPKLISISPHLRVSQAIPESVRNELLIGTRLRELMAKGPLSENEPAKLRNFAESLRMQTEKLRSGEMRGIHFALSFFEHGLFGSTVLITENPLLPPIAEFRDLLGIDIPLINAAREASTLSAMLNGEQAGLGKVIYKITFELPKIGADGVMMPDYRVMEVRNAMDETPVKVDIGISHFLEKTRPVSDYGYTARFTFDLQNQVVTITPKE